MWKAAFSIEVGNGRLGDDRVGWTYVSALVRRLGYSCLLLITISI